jgi:hypothetical protein
MLAVRSLGFGKLRKCASRLRPEAVTAIALLGALQAFSRENSVAGNELRSVEGDPYSVPAMPSACAAPVDRSIQRPFTNGPRSLIRTVTLRPLLCDVTVTREPNDCVR